ncbi:hypothetical protein SAMN04487947_0560 [Halogeometricum rufum]|uniref:Uncharacterized protein n=1 Tax=Halogeometricum rufum TaxID=553469 RepID=A0A1I6G4H2_9EURY|nr:hypothetical protein [Halogeometricum rufum]SFR37098.1 hypothetical protein SAMN04487947_0560 [Halogeometricum rufum]
MVSEYLLGVIIGGGIGLLSSLFVSHVQRKTIELQIKEETKRLHSEYFLSAKVDALVKLTKEIDSIYNFYNIHIKWALEGELASDEYYSEVIGAGLSFPSTIEETRLFLDSSLEEAVDNFAQQVILADLLLRDLSKLDLDQGQNSSNRLEKSLRELLDLDIPPDARDILDRELAKRDPEDPKMPSLDVLVAVSNAEFRIAEFNEAYDQCRTLLKQEVQGPLEIFDEN